MTLYTRFQAGLETVDIVVDNFPENPRDVYENAGTLWCWHRKYRFGSKEEAEERRRFDPADYGGWAELEEEIRKAENPVVLLPVYFYDHGSQDIAVTPFSCRWDSGQVGFIFARRESLKDFGAKIATKKVKEKIEACLRQEIATYAAYIRGDVFGWAKGEESCWGYYGTDEIPSMLEQALGKEKAATAEKVG